MRNQKQKFKKNWPLCSKGSCLGIRYSSYVGVTKWIIVFHHQSTFYDLPSCIIKSLPTITHHNSEQKFHCTRKKLLIAKYKIIEMNKVLVKINTRDQIFGLRNHL